MQKTSIEWTDLSANPLKYRNKTTGQTVWACVKTSPGCANCYSEATALRWDRGKLFNSRNMEELEPFLDGAELKEMRTRKVCAGVQVSGSRCFVCDMTDLFGEWVPDELLNLLFSTVLEARTDVTWQILTKRSVRMREYLSWRWGDGRIPARNIHVGVSVENQACKQRLEDLRWTPAAVRFVSFEPLLEDLGNLNLDGIDWSIVGCESGRQRRRMEWRWARQIREQCAIQGKLFFMKQGPVDGSVGGDVKRFPLDLQIREFPPCK